MGARGSFKPGFSRPNKISAVSAWLRVASATSDSNGVSSLPDMLNANPAVQSVDARKPVIENSANGLPCMRFATNDALAWPLIAATNPTNKAGWGIWLKPDSASAAARVISISTGTNGATALKLRLSTNTTPDILLDAAVSGTNGRRGTSSTLITTGWQFLTLEYDSSGATEADKLVATLNGIARSLVFSNLGAGGTLGVLPVVTGNAIIGNGQDGAASNPFNGLIGPNIYAFGSKMNDATQGLLTAAARIALMNYEAPA